MGAIDAELAALRITVNGLLETTASLSVRLAAAERKLPVEGGELVYSRPAEYRTPSFAKTTTQKLTEAFEALSGINVKRKLTRDDVIERAKRDVADLRTKAGIRLSSGIGFWPQIDRPSWAPMHKVEYVVNRDKRTVVALIKRLDGAKPIVGRAKAAPGDVFNTHIGKALSLRRALGLEIPPEYTDAPAPTEVRVGDVMDVRVWSLRKRTVNLDGKLGFIKIHLARDYFRDGKAAITDDSREEVSV